MSACRLLLVLAQLIGLPALAQVNPAALKGATAASPAMGADTREALMTSIQVSVIEFGRLMALLKVPAALLGGAAAGDAMRSATTRDLLVAQDDSIQLGGLRLRVELLPPDTVRLHSLDDGGKTYAFALTASTADESPTEGRSAGAQAAEGRPPVRPAMIKRGEPIHVALQALAQADGWTLLWYPAVSWKAIADVDLRRHKDAEAAIAEVISILRDEGKPVALRISEGNKVLEVLSTEVKND